MKANKGSKEKKAISGKFNAVDIAAVVFLILAVVLVGWKLAGSSGGDSERTLTMTFRALAEAVPVEAAENVREHLPGTLMASGKRLNGQVLDVEESPYYLLSGDGDWTPDPRRVNLIFTVTYTGPTGDVILSKVGEQEVRIGRRDYILKTEYFEFYNTMILDNDWQITD